MKPAGLHWNVLVQWQVLVDLNQIWSKYLVPGAGIEPARP